MVRPKLALIFLLALALSLFPHASTARSIGKHCGVTSCGNLSVSYPFRLKSQPQGCGLSWFELVCNNHRTIFPTEDGDFYVQNISYFNKTIHLQDVDVANHNCSIPLSSLPLPPIDNITFQNDFSLYEYSYSEYSNIYVVNCSMKMNKSWHGVNYINASRCSSSTQTNSNFYYFVDGGTPPSDFNPSCTVEARVPISLHNISGLSTFDIYKKLMMGTRIKWDLRLPNNVILDWSSVVNLLLSFLRVLALVALYILSNPYRILDKPIIVFQIPFLAITGMLLMRTFLGICCLITLIIYKLRRRHLSVDDAIENFLQSQINFMPIRYSYAELKKITGDFKDKLGDGGYVKLLKESKGNGQDFINEVATIGRIHHVNVVELVGFCVEGKKQALVYDFMTNGSLDKFIFSTNSSLSWQKMFEIVVGVGRCIEYLHNGCAMKILHFDIKPHNILLDGNFNPKLSDFGLAKLHSVDDSIISLTAARGTLGYMAPELFYKNLGGISYKADVYSFGMMLMEIVGRRKNLNAFADNSRENIELESMTENVNKIVRKMIIVAFWCIQTKPIHRPTMTKVLKMLESEEELFEIPPKSFLFSVDMSSNDNDY
ncbi:hypothetical protein ES319_D01G044900v1 [Gossypium barbadense]|uniref:non-specific serine/threonine protein kinase n=1 Tax=Gossypium barbadense TaxID=3634 RepID=A0A5J5SQU8_GOSBA|nr:hypothetical protein ES319_D01G044900v1 [Gossypium barbadense]